MMVLVQTKCSWGPGRERVEELRFSGDDALSRAMRDARARMNWEASVEVRVSVQ